MSEFSHIPVMPREAVDALQIKPDGVYVDGTLGGGGHSALICGQLTTGKLIGIDRDEEAIAAASAKINENKNFVPVHGNFHSLPEILDRLAIENVDGILLDLGVSSHQIDTPGRGFSFRHDGPLDMRMSRDLPVTARNIVNEFSEKELTQIFFDFGEERFSKKIARAICKAREISPLETTLQLAEVIKKAVPAPAPHPAMRTFMALRIAVNDELLPLGAALRGAVRRLAKNGRIAVITFHSLEDRIVKSTIARLVSPCECPRDIPYCVCGKTPALRLVTRKPLTPSTEELSANRRAHSAKLRVAERI